jgi:hypothetical protein
MQGVFFGRTNVRINGVIDQFKAILPPDEELQLIGRSEGTAVQASPVINEIILAYFMIVTVEDYFRASLDSFPDLLRSQRLWLWP